MSPNLSKVVPVIVFVSFKLPAKSSTMVTIALLSFSAGVTVKPVTSPFSIVNVIFVATLYPLGAASSCIVYFPFGRFNNVAADVPEVNLIVSAPPSAANSSLLISATLESTLLLVNLIGVPSLFSPVMKIVAPASSSLPVVAFLLISTLVPLYKLLNVNEGFFAPTFEKSIVPETVFVLTVHVAPELVVSAPSSFGLLSVIDFSSYGLLTFSTIVYLTPLGILENVTLFASPFFIVTVYMLVFVGS